MSAELKDRIKSKMHDKRLTVSELEKLAGLKANAVRNILLGKTKNPKVDRLQALAEVLGCSIAELIGAEESPSIQEKPSPTLEYPHLLQESMDAFIYNLEKEDGTFSLNEAMEVVRETYLYSLESPGKKLDKTFAKWQFNHTKNQKKKR